VLSAYIMRSQTHIPLLIVSDVRLYRDALARLFERNDRFQLVGTAADAGEVFDHLRISQPRIVLLDVAMPDSFATARTIMEIAPDVKVIALSVAEAERDFMATAEAGMAGLVMRQGSVADLLAALERAARGEIATLDASQPSQSRHAHLTPREREILPLLDRGLSNKEIARRLGIEAATVKNHVHNILDKLQVHRRGEAAARVRRAFSLVPGARYSAAG